MTVNTVRVSEAWKVVTAFLSRGICLMAFSSSYWLQHVTIQELLAMMEKVFSFIN